MKAPTWFRRLPPNPKPKGPLLTPLPDEVQIKLSPALKLPPQLQAPAGHCTAMMLFGPASETLPPRPLLDVTPKFAPRVVPSPPSCAQLYASPKPVGALSPTSVSA